MAKKVAKELTLHGQTRVDEYYWLNERKNPEVIAYLQAENAYTDAVMKPTAPLRETLYKEMVGRMQQTRHVGALFRERLLVLHPLRKREGLPGLLPQEKIPAREASRSCWTATAWPPGTNYFNIGSFAVSPDNAILAYSVDTVSRRQYRIRFRSLKTGKEYPGGDPDDRGRMAWAKDSRTVFYPVIDPETLRSFKVNRHVLGTPAERRRRRLRGKGRDVRVSHRPEPFAPVH